MVWRNLSRVLDSQTHDDDRIQIALSKVTSQRTTAKPSSTLDHNSLIGESELVSDSVRDLNPMNSAEVTPALKEWAVVCRALEEGRQVLLLRKGGIKEYRRGFEVKHNPFLLYPTFEHQSRESIQPDYVEKFETVMRERPSDLKNKITSFARAVMVKQITGGALSPDLDKYHIWNDNYVKVRMNYNPKKPMNIVLLRVYKLATPIEVDVKSEWHGCKSWIPIESLPLQSMDQTQERNRLYPEHHRSHKKYSNNIRYYERPVLEDSKFEKITAEIEEILNE